MKGTIRNRISSRVLWPAARLWALGARARGALYGSALSRQRLARPVVSVGNLSAGGTGKTPFVIWLHKELVARGLRPAVLTRGYRRAGSGTLVFEEAGGPLPEENEAGDEVRVMLQRGVAPIGVDSERSRAAHALETRMGSKLDLFLLDDGFQHLKLERDLDIVLIDTSTPPWEDELLPAGRLREPLSALARADVVVLTRLRAWTTVEPLRERLRRYAPRAEIYMTRTRLLGPGPKTAELRLTGPVLAFAGIGNPRAFFADLCVCGVQVVGVETFRDHHRYTVRDLLRLERRAREVEAEALVTTEKDAANLPRAYRNGLEMPLRIVGAEMEIDGGSRLVDRVERLVRVSVVAE